MGAVISYKKQIMDLTEELSGDKLKELLDFAEFLKAKKEGFTYMQVKDSAAYVRELRIKDARRVKTGKKFLNEILEWQKSNS